MVGKKGGVSAFLTQLQPSCITVHCFAHCLELAYKDPVKENKLYDSCIVLLMGLYYFYHNSPKQRQNLKQSFQSLNQSSVMQTRVGGTRWVGHMMLAVENFLKGYQAIHAQLEDCIMQKVNKIIVYLFCIINKQLHLRKTLTCITLQENVTNILITDQRTKQHITLYSLKSQRVLKAHKKARRDCFPLSAA